LDGQHLLLSALMLHVVLVAAATRIQLCLSELFGIDFIYNYINVKLVRYGEWKKVYTTILIAYILHCFIAVSGLVEYNLFPLQYLKLR
jgi:hypothetical protein